MMDKDAKCLYCHHQEHKIIFNTPSPVSCKGRFSTQMFTTMTPTNHCLGNKPPYMQLTRRPGLHVYARRGRSNNNERWYLHVRRRFPYSFLWRCCMCVDGIQYKVEWWLSHLRIDDVKHPELAHMYNFHLIEVLKVRTFMIWMVEKATLLITIVF